ncbi:NGG1p interacting factor NIF3 [Adhaeribacter rhizoryzae]|uniref:NGG1p interacting factor NIF3 n=2 Tax=Adhaeribacter rhizoryzae TaxID=2607907 RepID=A0A5M6D718_9BACT|nr:NGG1p interacting factor NIF3 [Adhaeribacter rhizoryzae]
MASNKKNINQLGRRKFITALGNTVGASGLITTPIVTMANNLFRQNQTFTVRQIIALFLKEVPGAPFNTTVDTLESGSLDTKVTGIVTTMFATLEVIRKAIDLGANFIIAHEPTFYNHQDDTAWLEQDDVYRYKADLLKKHNIAVWRNHDYIHSHKPDGVQTGLVAALGWQKYYNPEIRNRFVIPAISLKTIISLTKEKLGIQMVRYIGDLSQNCERILLLPGASGGKRHIEEIIKEKPDVIMVGEAQEWETVEYVRDARAKGNKLSLVLLGHAVSEEPGAEWLVAWLKPKVPGLKITHVPSRNPLSFI